MMPDSGETTVVRTIGRYRAFGEIGRGAMGVVYRGFDPIIGRTVALKTLSLDTDDVEAGQFRERLYREAAAAGALSHPNIVTIYDIVEDDDTTAVAMEFIEGRSLSAIIAERAPLPLELAVEILDQVCSALDYAGSQGIVHRDIKPANILLTAAGRAKVTDFGVARLALSTMTQAGTVLGSPSYMSPEQVRGLSLDGRSDLFSAAVVFFEMITRKRPFAGNDIATTMYRIAHEPPTPPSAFNPAIGSEIAAVLERAFAKSPAARFQTGAELVTALRAAAGLAVMRGASPMLAALAAAPPPVPPIAAPDAAEPVTAVAVSSGAPPEGAPIPVAGDVAPPAAQAGAATVPPITGPRAALAVGPSTSNVALPTIPRPPGAPGPAAASASALARRSTSGRRRLLLGAAATAAVLVAAVGAWLMRGGFGPAVEAPPAAVEPTPTPLIAEPVAPLAPPVTSDVAPSAPPAPLPPAPAAGRAVLTPAGRGGAPGQAKTAVRPLPAEPATDTGVAAAPLPPAASAPLSAQAAEGRVYLATEVDVKPEVLTQVAPQFPEDAAKRNVQDVVILQVLVNASGRPETIKVLRGSRKAESLDTAAASAVRQWTFRPAKKNGQPVPSWFNIGVPFPPVK